MKLFHCGVDVIHNEWQHIEAENEDEAIERVKKFISARDSVHIENIDVHNISEVEVSDESI